MSRMRDKTEKVGRFPLTRDRATEASPRAAARLGPDGSVSTSAKEAHRQRMVERRRRQLAREPGFTPISNARIDKAIAAATLALRLQGKGPVEAQEEATRHVARQLPPAPRVKSHRPRPSKSDDPAYRKPFVRDMSRRARGEV